MKTAVPPPFNLPYVLHALAVHAWCRLRYGKKGSRGKLQAEGSSRKGRYPRFRHQQGRGGFTLEAEGEEEGADSAGASVKGGGRVSGDGGGSGSYGTFYTDIDLAVDKFVKQTEAQQHSSAEAMLSRLLEKQAQAGEEHRLKLMQIEEMLSELKNMHRGRSSRPMSPVHAA